MFWFIWQSGFREDFLEINQSETRFACAAMFVNGSELNDQSLSRAFEGTHGRKHPWKVIYKDFSFSSDLFNKHGRHRQFLFLIGRFLTNHLL
jgi:hypothetical protein